MSSTSKTISPEYLNPYIHAERYYYQDNTLIQDRISRERHARIILSFAAYAYEYMNDPIMSDADFDVLSMDIDVNIPTISDYHYKDFPELVTRYQILDDFFKKEFSPYTGQWIHKHPELDILDMRYQTLFKNRTKMLTYNRKIINNE